MPAAWGSGSANPLEAPVCTRRQRTGHPSCLLSWKGTFHAPRWEGVAYPCSFSDSVGSGVWPPRTLAADAFWAVPGEDEREARQRWAGMGCSSSVAPREGSQLSSARLGSEVCGGGSSGDAHKSGLWLHWCSRRAAAGHGRRGSGLGRPPPGSPRTAAKRRSARCSTCCAP